MSGIRKSQRLINTPAACGHMVQVLVPPGELSEKGNQRLAQANKRLCYHCKQDREADEAYCKAHDC